MGNHIDHIKGIFETSNINKFIAFTKAHRMTRCKNINPGTEDISFREEPSPLNKVKKKEKKKCNADQNNPISRKKVFVDNNRLVEFYNEQTHFIMH